MLWDEEQKAVEDDFLKSWDLLEEFIVQIQNESNTLVYDHYLALIHWFRAHGYERHLRVGLRGSWFVVSRAREHKLRIDQPFMSLVGTHDDMMYINFRVADVHVSRLFDREEVMPHIHNLAEMLRVYPID